MSIFKDHFSGHAHQYANYRPGYPPALFDYLATLVPDQEVAWDCATGSGQAALMLAKQFTRVVATDASVDQLSQISPADRIKLHCATAEASGLQSGSIDLVTVAQALHWFDFDAFHAEVRRVLKPAGVLAVWCYGLATVDDGIDSIIANYHDEIVGRYWPPERFHIESRYKAIPFPWDELPTPGFSMTVQWRLQELMGYLDTWSATQRYKKDKGSDPREQIEPFLTNAWGNPHKPRKVSWPLTLRVGRMLSD